MTGSLSIANGIAADERAQVAELLGREPRGLEAIATRDRAGAPVVIRVASLVDDEPFPTLYWLVGARESYLVDQLEAGGLIAQLQAQVDSDPTLQQTMGQDHQCHIERRYRLMSPRIRSGLVTKGYYDDLASRGIGGIANFTRIRCLHTWFAAHCVEPNTIGHLLEYHCPSISKGLMPIESA